MALAYRSSGTFTEANSTSSGSIGLPAGLANGDIMILPVQARGTAGTVDTPSGYTRAGEINITASHRLVVFYKYVTNAAGEAAPTVTQTVSGAIRARLSAFSGGHATTQLDVDAVFAKHTDLATVTAPTATPVSQGAMAIWIFSTGDDNSLNAATQGTTAYADQGTLGADGSLALVYELQTNATPVGTCAMTESANGPDNWNTATVILRPAAVAASNPSRDIGYDSLNYIVEAAFGASPFAPEPTWTDISAYVRAGDGIVVQRGRGSEFTDTQPGTMTLTLNNRDRVFDPDYSSGTYYGQLVPQTRIRFRTRHQSVNYPIFDGYIQGWPQSYAYPREAVVQITAFDLFSRLATRKLPPTRLALEVLADAPAVYLPMLEDALPVAADLSGNGWATTYSNFVEVVDSPLQGEATQKAKRIVETNGRTLDVITATGDDITLASTVEVWFRIDDLGPAPTYPLDTVAWVVGSTNATTILIAGLIQDDDDNPVQVITAYLYDATGTLTTTIYVPFSLGVTYQLVTVLDSTATFWTVYLNGVDMASANVSAFTFESGTAGSGIQIITDENCDVTLSHFAVYEAELSAERVLIHFDAGVTGGALELAADRLEAIADFAGLVDANLYAGTDMGANTFLGADPPTGNALSAMQDIIRTEQGRLFASSSGILAAQGRAADMGELTVNSTSQATLSDSGSYAYAEVPIDSASIDLMRNAIYVSTGGATVTVIDADSRDTYDELEESLSVILDDPTAATNLGLSRLRRFAEPTSRINQVKIIPHGATDVRYALCLGVELGWRLTVTRTPQGLGSAISKVVTVEGITHTFTDSHMETTLYLVPAQEVYTAHPWFVMGDATYGRFGTAAGNALPY